MNAVNRHTATDGSICEGALRASLLVPVCVWPETSRIGALRARRGCAMVIANVRSFLQVGHLGCQYIKSILPPKVG